MVFEYNIFSLRVKLCGCKDFLSESKVIPCKCCYCYASSFLWLPISFKLALYQCIQKISVLPFHSRYIVVAQGDLISWKGGKSWAFFNLPVMIGNYKTTSVHGQYDRSCLGSSFEVSCVQRMYSWTFLQQVIWGQTWETSWDRSELNRELK